MAVRFVGATLVMLFVLALAGCGGSDGDTPVPSAITDREISAVATPSPVALETVTEIPVSPVAATPRPVLEPTASPAGSPAVSALAFSLLVSAREVDKDFRPVERTDRFPANASRIYVVAHLSGSGEAELMIRWVAVEATGVERDKVILERSVHAASGDRYGFYLEPPAGGIFPVGQYKVDLYLGGQLAKTVPYSVTADPGTSTATAASVERPTPLADQRVVAVLARDVTDDYQPVNATSVFSSATEKIHLVFTAKDLPEGSTLEAVWIAESVDVDVAPNFEIDRARLSITGSAPGDFTLSRPNDGFPNGSYRVELFLSGTLISVHPFTVEEG